MDFAGTIALSRPMSAQTASSFSCPYYRWFPAEPSKRSTCRSAQPRPAAGRSMVGVPQQNGQGRVPLAGAVWTSGSCWWRTRPRGPSEEGISACRAAHGFRHCRCSSSARKRARRLGVPPVPRSCSITARPCGSLLGGRYRSAANRASSSSVGLLGVVGAGPGWPSCPNRLAPSPRLRIGPRSTSTPRPTSPRSATTAGVSSPGGGLSPLRLRAGPTAMASAPTSPRAAAASAWRRPWSRPARPAKGLRGIGRCAADFWPVLKGKSGRRLTVLGRCPENRAIAGGGR